MTTALTALTLTTITGALVGVMINGRRESSQTGAYESLRLAGHQIMEDGRFALEADDDWGETLTFKFNAAGTDYITYTFASWDGENDPVPDPQNLHRWVVHGGVLQADEIIARDMVPPSAPGGTGFGAEAVDESKEARAVLVRKPLPGQQWPITLEVRVMQR